MGVACAGDAEDPSATANLSGTLEVRVETPELNPDQPHRVAVVADPAIAASDVDPSWNVVRYEDVPVGEYKLAVSLANYPWTGVATVEVREDETTSETVAVE
jgi:hypothetical protein